MEREFRIDGGQKIVVKLPANAEKKARQNWCFSAWKDFGEMLADGTFVERLLEVLYDVVAAKAVAEPIYVICDKKVTVALDIRVRRQDDGVEVLVNKLYPCVEP